MCWCGRASTSEARGDIEVSGAACRGWGAAAERKGGWGRGRAQEFADGPPPLEKVGRGGLCGAGHGGQDDPDHREGVGGSGEDGFAWQDRRRSRAGGRGDRGGLLAGGGVTRFACGQAEVSVKGGGAEHGGGEDRGRRFAGRRRGREPAGWLGGRGIAQGRRGGDGKTLVQGGGDVEVETPRSAGEYEELVVPA